MRMFTTVFLFCMGLLVAGCGGGGGGGGTSGTSSGTVGYEVDWTEGANHIWGPICGLDQPFTLNFTSGEGISGTLAFSPDNLEHAIGDGNVIENGNKSGMPAGSSLTYSGTGTYKFTTTQLIFAIAEQKATLTLPPPAGTQVLTVPGISAYMNLESSTKCQ